jgi:Uma2 family endonuclease
VVTSPRAGRTAAEDPAADDTAAGQAAFIAQDNSTLHDRIIVLHGATWADYQRLLELRGEEPVPRLAYLEGELELMSPSRPHESIKSKIGCLIEVWCLHHGIEFSPYGSWTLEKKEVDRGVEADECYVFGAALEPERPDLAIEVVWTSGGINKLEIYRKLEVREVWFWRRGQLTIHVLEAGSYRVSAASVVLPGIDVGELGQYLVEPMASRAIRAYRQALESR